jgi:hypothetical protein
VLSGTELAELVAPFQLEPSKVQFISIAPVLFTETVIVFVFGVRMIVRQLVQERRNTHISIVHCAGELGMLLTVNDCD